MWQGFCYVENTLRLKIKRKQCCGLRINHLDANPDPAFHFDADPDPTFQFDADPDPSTNQIWTLQAPMLQNDPPSLPTFHCDAYPNPAFRFDADLDPSLHFDAVLDPDPDPASPDTQY